MLDLKFNNNFLFIYGIHRDNVLSTQIELSIQILFFYSTPLTFKISFKVPTKNALRKKIPGTTNYAAFPKSHPA
jgi:hypothetical protein